MANNELDLEVESVEDIVEIKNDEGIDTTDWKSLALKNQGIAKRFKTKLEKVKELKQQELEKKPEIPEKKEKDSFDYAELAYLEGARGITEEEDQNYILQEVKTTGKNLKEVVNFNYIKEKLQENKEARITKNALPQGGNRGTSNKDLDYWGAQIASGKAKLSDIPDKNLRREVLNNRIKTEQDKSKFAPDSVVIG